MDKKYDTLKPKRHSWRIQQKLDSTKKKNLFSYKIQGCNVTVRPITHAPMRKIMADVWLIFIASRGDWWEVYFLPRLQRVTWILTTIYFHHSPFFFLLFPIFFPSPTRTCPRIDECVCCSPKINDDFFFFSHPNPIQFSFLHLSGVIECLQA